MMNDAGRIGFLIKGDYNSLIQYNFLDVVYYQGSSYVAKKTTVGNAPDEDNDYWHILAKGATGSIDEELSTTSHNAVENKAISLGLNEKVGKSSILTTVEQCVASTDSGNIPNAAVINELNSNLTLIKLKHAFVSVPQNSSITVIVDIGDLGYNSPPKIIGYLSGYFSVYPIEITENNATINVYNFTQSERGGSIILSFSS